MKEKTQAKGKDKNNENENELELEEHTYSEEERENQEENAVKGIMNEEAYKKYTSLLTKMSEAKNLNRQAVKEENIRNNDPNYEKNQNQLEYKANREKLKRNLLEQGVPENKLFTLDPINKAENQIRKNLEKKHKATFGWDAFNTDSIYRAHEKRVNKMPFDSNLYEKNKANPELGFKVTEERKQLLKGDIDLQ
jgi:hypothetical protein